MDEDLLLQLAAAGEAERLAAQRVLSLIERLRAESVSWPRIGKALGTTGEAARWKARSATGGEPWMQARKAPDDPSIPKARPVAGQGPGISVTEASQRLGISRVQVYRRVKAGTLPWTTDPASGYLRILLGGDPSRQSE